MHHVSAAANALFCWSLWIGCVAAAAMSALSCTGLGRESAICRAGIRPQLTRLENEAVTHYPWAAGPIRVVQQVLGLHFSGDFHGAVCSASRLDCSETSASQFAHVFRRQGTRDKLLELAEPVPRHVRLLIHSDNTFAIFLR